MSQGTLIVSLDFELFWGMQQGRSLEEYKKNVLGGRTTIPRLLRLFEKYKIHVTWATVGFMFARNAEEARKYFPREELLPDYEEKEMSSYRCFKDIAADPEETRCFYASSLIHKISLTEGMEIGCHTFSHYFCKEQGQTPEQFEADIQAAKAIASAKGYDLTSIVLPQNQCEPDYIRRLAGLGFNAYRDEENDWIHEKVKPESLMRLLRLCDVYLPLTGQGGYQPKKEDGIWNLMGSRMYKPFFKSLRLLEKLKVRRIKRQMCHAARNGLVFHLWWHPHNIGIHQNFHLRQLEEILRYYQFLHDKYGMRSLNMGEMAADLEDKRG